MPSTCKLCTYTGDKIEVIGAIDVDIEYKNQKHKLNFFNWWSRALDHLYLEEIGCSMYIQLDWAQLSKVQTEHTSKLEEHLNAHATLFTPGLGKIEGIKAKLFLTNNSKAKFLRACQVPLAI